MELRAGYKRTEIGIFPKDWEVKKLEQVSLFFNGKAHEQAIDENGKYVVVNSKFVSTEGLIFKNSKEAISPLQKGDITMVMSDIPNGKALAKCYLIEKDDRYTLNQRICSIKTELCDTVFLFYILNRNKYFLSFDSGSGQTNLRRKEVLDCPLVLPPTKAEQTAIATALSDADALISGLEKLLAKKRNIKQGAMQKLLQPKEGWEVKKLGEVCLILNNLRIPIKESSRIKGETPYYGANGIQGYIEGFTHNGEYVLVAEDGANDLNNYPTNYTSGKIWVNNHAHVLQGVISILSTKFLSYILKSIDFQDVLVGGTRAKLNKSILEKIEIPFPSLIEQTRIATILSDMDAEITALETKLEKYRKVKLGMMQNLLTGKIRLV